MVLLKEVGDEENRDVCRPDCVDEDMFEQEDDITGRPIEQHNFSVDGISCNISDIPDDIVHTFLINLSTKCLYRLKSVSRKWSSMIDDIITRRSSNPRLAIRTVRRTNTSDMLEIAILDSNWRVVNRFWEELHHCYHQPSFSGSLQQSPIQYPTLCPVQSCHGIVCLGMGDGHVILFNPATEQMLQLPSIGLRYQCIGLAYSGGEFKVILWFTDPFGQNCCTILTLGPYPWRDGWRTAVDPPFRVMSGRAPFVEGCIHILPDPSEIESQRILDRIEPFHADTEAYRQSIRLPESFYSRSKPPTARNLFEMNNCLSICITLDDCVEMWRLSDYDNIGWIMEHHVSISSLLAAPYKHHAIIVDPVTVLEDGQIVMNVGAMDSTVQLVTYDTIKKEVISRGQENSASVSYTETIFDLRVPEHGDPRYVWSPIVTSDEEESNCDYPNPYSAARSDEEASNSFPCDDSMETCDLVGSDYPDSTSSSSARRQGIQNTETSVEARSSEDLLRYDCLLHSRITIDEKDGPGEEEDCMLSLQEEEPVRKLTTLPSDENVVRLLFHMPDDTRRTGFFTTSDKLEVVFGFLDATGLVIPGSYNLVRFPRHVLTAQEYTRSLADMGIISKNEALFVVPIGRK